MRNACLLTLCCALFGCAKKPTTVMHSAPPPKLDSSWISHPASDFTLAAPSDWILSLQSMTMSGLNVGNLDQLSQSMPSDSGTPPPPPTPKADSADPEDLQRQQSEGIVLELYDKSVKPIPGEAMTRMYVKTKASDGPIDQMSKDEAKDLEAKSTKMVDLPIGKAGELNKESTTRGGDVVTDVIFLVENGDKAYEFTFETTNHETELDEPSQQIMQTLRFKGK